MKRTIVLIVLCCIFLSGCPLMQRHADQEAGSLIIDLLTSAMGVKTIVPPLDMEVEHYDVRGDGPDAAAFSQLGVTGSTVFQNSMAAGAWTIAVDAFNSNGDLIGAGTADVRVEAGTTAGASVQVKPLTGTGVLSISVSWPSGTITVPVVSGTLTPAGGAPETLTFTMGTDAAWYSSGALAAGYYSLVLQLSDGATVEWGAFEAVRVLKAQTTTAGFILTTGDLLSGE